ncbi:DUF4160 domain-containing protein [Azospirillum halopraeferens]|uniref:DUF4160 domain-containing protein n=1 Tax=Azospirillum halopraeferens TaxID=34010 RepID=UPI00042186BA|nr:DUF4160 domain-containing protein [Azospirillum halopraeferens]
MGKLATIGTVRIIVQGRDHNPPHFHVKGPGVNALVRIDPVAVLRGSVPSGLWAEIAAWAVANRATLVAEWTRCNPEAPSAERQAP